MQNKNIAFTLAMIAMIFAVINFFTTGFAFNGLWMVSLSLLFVSLFIMAHEANKDVEHVN